MTTQLNSSAEIILGMRIMSDTQFQSAGRGTIHCTLLFTDISKKVALSHRHHVNLAYQKEVEAGLQALARSVAERLKWSDGQNRREHIILMNGIPPKDVECGNLSAHTRLDEHQLDFFRQSLQEYLGLPDQDIPVSLALVKWVEVMSSPMANSR